MRSAGKRAIGNDNQDERIRKVASNPSEFDEANLLLVNRWSLSTVLGDPVPAFTGLLELWLEVV
jgi:hypothetical protein